MSNEQDAIEKAIEEAIEALKKCFTRSVLPEVFYQNCFTRTVLPEVF